MRRTIESVSLPGRSGVSWQDARIVVTPRHKDWRWLRWETECLGTAGSNLLALRVNVARRADAPMGANIQLRVWPRTGAARAYVERGGEPRPYGPGQYEYTVRCGDWLAFACGRASYLGIVPRREPGWNLGLENLGDGHFMAGASRWLTLDPPVSRLGSLLWIAPCRSLKEAHAYRFLREMDDLP